MAEPNFAPMGQDPSDDLPRTFRREKEARAREAQERAQRERAAAPSLSTVPDANPAAASAPKFHAEASSAATAAYPDAALQPAVVRSFDVPFMHLVGFFTKCVFAAIPALLLLTAVLWIFGSTLQAFFPDLVKMKILIGVGS